MSTRKLTFAAMMAALTVVLLYIAALVPMVELTLCAAAAVCAALTIARCGFTAGAMVYAASVLLAWLLLPNKYPAVCYTMLFGAYPVIKHLAERVAARLPWRAQKPATWLMKLGAANLLAVLAALLFRWAFLGEGEPVWYLPLMLGLYNLVLLVYDVALNRIILHIHKRTKGKKL